MRRSIFCCLPRRALPSAVIPQHKHHAEDEILLIQTGSAHVWLGDKEYDARNISLVSIWNEPGFEEMLLCGSVPKGQSGTNISIFWPRISCRSYPNRISVRAFTKIMLPSPLTAIISSGAASSRFRKVASTLPSLFTTRPAVCAMGVPRSHIDDESPQISRAQLSQTEIAFEHSGQIRCATFASECFLT
jgi:hypothetical protein